MSDESLIEVTNLKKYFYKNDSFVDRLLGLSQTIKAVDGVSFTIEEGETLGLVGESGSGKSTTGEAILRLLQPTKGSIKYKGKELGDLSKDRMKQIRNEMQIIFQDPTSSLNRRKTAGQIIKEPMIIHNLYSGSRNERVDELLETVGIHPRNSNRYPHEFSGGQRQRIGIARALAVDPDFIIADEPVSALDVSIQAQILNLFKDLQEDFNFSLLFIAHDLSVIRYICDRVAVMYLGKIIEIGDTDEIFYHPQHPYTRSLIEAIPEADPKLAKQRGGLKGQVPSPIDPPSGCSFHPRCPKAVEECEQSEPRLETIHGSTDGHLAACLKVDKFEPHMGVSQDNQIHREEYGIENFDLKNDQPRS